MPTKFEISKNVHPNTDGSPWGWIQITGTKIRVATWSGHNELKLCRELIGLAEAKQPEADQELDDNDEYDDEMCNECGFINCIC